ncbi:MAG: HAD-IC family P-type ATPase, partial [Pirellulaceae bacterium]
MDEMIPSQLHRLDAEDVVEQLGSDIHTGLDLEEVETRRARFGPNTITSARGQSEWMRLLLQFHQPLIYILLAAALVTAALEEWIDSGVIFGVVLVNALIGYIQESKAAKALEALAQTTVTEARVLREGTVRLIPSEKLVPGDVILLQSGDKVPADIRLFRARDLQIDESALTGESVPVSKLTAPLPDETPLADRKNLAYSSSLVTYGQGQGIVYATGGATEVGRISDLISKADALETPLTQKLAKFSHILLFIILVLSGLTFAVGMLRGDSTVVDMFMAAVALAVGAIPEGLPAAVTITLAIGVNRMARRRAIIRKLPAVETLGSTNVICSDKTGTLTVNQMTVRQIWAGNARYDVSGDGYDPQGEFAAIDSIPLEDNEAARDCLLTGLLCNDATLIQEDEQWHVEGDPTEGALLVSAGKGGKELRTLADAYARLDSLPFESQHQYMASLHEAAGQRRLLLVKGAVEVLLAKSTVMRLADGKTVPIDPAQVQRHFDEMAAQGLRVLAMGIAEVDASLSEIRHEDVKDLTFVGLQGMIDPPRQEAIHAVAACHRAGIEVKMITGDHAKTAESIAEKIGIIGPDDPNSNAPRVLTSADLADRTDEQLQGDAKSVSVFARVTPEQKLRLVRALQADRSVIAMTGDGVNDAPALKQADIGIAMGMGGTEVAKEAADMILTDDNFATIQAAVEEGRGVFDNLTKFIAWTLPTNIGEGLVILAAVFVGTALPILPVQILWINMTTAVLLGLMLAFEPKEPDIMDRPPRDPNEPILTLDIMLRILTVGILLLVGAFGAFQWATANVNMSEDAARTVAVNVFVVVEMFYLYNCRSLTKSVWRVGLFTNHWLTLGVLTMIVLQLAFTYAPFMNLA